MELKTIQNRVCRLPGVVYGRIGLARGFSSATVEGISNKAKVALRKLYGFRSYKSC